MNAISTIHYACCLLLISIMTSCSSVQRSNQQITLDGGAQYRLQAIPDNLRGQGMLQQLRVTAPSGEHELLLQTEIRSHGITMVGMSSSGLVLFELSWTETEGLVSRQTIATDAIEPAILLAYLQLTRWPVAAVEKGLQGLQLRVAKDNQYQRHYYQDGTLAFSISAQPGEITMQHYVFHYQITITTLQTFSVDD